VDGVRAGVAAGVGHDRAGGGRTGVAVPVRAREHGPRPAVRDASGIAWRSHHRAATGQPAGLDSAGHGPGPDRRPSEQRLRGPVGRPPRWQPTRHRPGDLAVQLRVDACGGARPVPAAAVSRRAAARTTLAPGRLDRRRAPDGHRRGLCGPGLAGPRDDPVPRHDGQHDGNRARACAPRRRAVPGRRGTPGGRRRWLAPAPTPSAGRRTAADQVVRLRRHPLGGGRPDLQIPPAVRWWPGLPHLAVRAARGDHGGGVSLPAVRHRPAAQPDSGVRAGHRDPGDRLRRPGARTRAAAGPAPLQPRGGRGHARGGGAVPAPAAPHPAGGGPALRPAPLRRSSGSALTCARKSIWTP
jgi:hypothetical protein